MCISYASTFLTLSRMPIPSQRQLISLSHMTVHLVYYLFVMHVSWHLVMHIVKDIYAMHVSWRLDVHLAKDIYAMYVSWHLVM